MNWRNPALLTGVGVAATIVLTVAVVLTLLLTSGAKAVSDNAAIIGALVALGGVFTTQLVNSALDDRRTQESRNIEAQRTQESRNIEAQRTQESRNIEAQRTREAALQNYFEKVGTLLIDYPLHRASPGDNLSTVVRAQTLTVLEGLDPDRKGILVMFLYDSGLILKDKRVVSLVGANLSEANLSDAYLAQANLSMANLSGANLSLSALMFTDLRGANLSEANMGETIMFGTDLSEADLNEAFQTLSSSADLSEAWQAPLSRAGTPLTKVGTDLREANLSEAILNSADLSGATGITIEELEQQAFSLEGATMPDGQKYEDWLKDKEGSGKDAENE